MSDQPNALRLAKWLDAMPSSGYALPNQAATELRRLHEVNQELLEALESIALSEKVAKDLDQQWCAAASGMVRMARAAIAKATGGEV